MITRHQRSTLFPYTTLFRSVLIMTLGFLVTAPMTLIIGVILAIKEDATLSLILVVIMPLLVGLILLLMTKAIDRKSTRLNSSHPSISYAVFCLKKKRTLDST